MECFFYGTLMDADVLGAVIGRRVPASAVEPAWIEGFRRVYRRGAWYPVLVEAPGGRVDGIVVAGLSDSEAARLVAFEGDEYRLETRTVHAARRGRRTVGVFVPVPGVPATDEDWTPDGFRRRHRAEYLRRVRSRAVSVGRAGPR